LCMACLGESWVNLSALDARALAENMLGGP
jgi:hypothetical protein